MKGIVHIVVFLAALGLLCFTFFGIPVAAVWVALIFWDSSGRAGRAMALVDQTLMPGEQIVTKALQMRALALLHRREVVAITDSRILLIRRPLLGGFKMIDIQWKDLADVRLEQNILPDVFGSNLGFAHFSKAAAPLHLDGVPSQTASEIYSRAQMEEQAWEEKRRVRQMEEVRAAAGGVIVHTAPSGASSATTSSGKGLLQDIQEAKKLLDAGVISDAEFQEMKAKILSAA